MNEAIAPHVGPAGLDIAYEVLGDPAHPTVLLCMGLAAQMVHWNDGFLDALLARDLRLVRFDNRDAGHSTHLHDAPPADLPAALAGDYSSASYTLSDMAADAIGLLDHLGIDSVHAVGASLGGALAQTLALEHPDRVRSLTSMMSTTGDPSVGQAHPATLKGLFGGPRVVTREDAVERALRGARITGSPRYPRSPDELARTAALAWDRDHDEPSVVRQAVASVASGDRTEALRTLVLPTLVVHGLADTLADPSGGRATAAAIPGSTLLLFEGMGHDLPRELWDPIVDAIAAVVERGERVRA
ncbi:MAG: alpha/beta hydrolase [Myxococcota bacterium]